MPSLTSELFRGDQRLAKCLVSDPDHITVGSCGPFVSKIQYAVLVLEGGTISGSEMQAARYGRDTARVVLAYKTRRKIINPAYQKVADDIVGKMTMQALDIDMRAFEAREVLAQLNSRSRSA